MDKKFCWERKLDLKQILAGVTLLIGAIVFDAEHNVANAVNYTSARECVTSQGTNRNSSFVNFKYFNECDAAVVIYLRSTTSRGTLGVCKGNRTCNIPVSFGTAKGVHARCTEYHSRNVGNGIRCKKN
jgi:hypothetical protein